MSRLSALFTAYTARHGQVARRGCALRDAQGAQIGHIDRIALGRDWVEVAGWCLAAEVGLAAGARSVRTPPHLPRADVTRAHGLGPAVKPGFRLRLDGVSGAATFWAETGAERCSLPLAALSRAETLRLHLAVAPSFLRDATRAAPAALRWLRHRDSADAGAVRALMGLAGPPRPGLLSAPLFAAPDAAQTAPQTASPSLHNTPVTLIVPVYNAFELLPDMLQRVVQNTDLPWHLIVVEDASTDARVRPWLTAWRADLPEALRTRVTLLENEANLGFVGAVNRGLAQALPLGHHVILLNSDAFVPERWASRLIRPMLGQGDVASVTPFSNDAEIFTAPLICAPQSLPPGAADRLDAVAQRFAWAEACAEAPTGVGFCMALNIDFLARIPGFDPAFGQGYGEEVDWCCKARAAGGRNLGFAGLFVEHQSGASFGAETKAARVRAASARISARYPGYDAAVQGFIRDDPLLTQRLALAIACAAEVAAAAKGAQTTVPVYLAHDMGGGAAHDLAARVARDGARGLPALVLRVGGLRRWELELHMPQGATTGNTSATISGSTDDTALVLALIGLLPARRVVYSCGVGDREPTELPGLLCQLADGAPHRLEVLFHDYFALSPSHTLLDSHGTYTGVPAPGSADPAHTHLRADGRAVPLSEWRQAWGALLEAADELTVFSASSQALVAQAYPNVAGALRVRPHHLAHAIPKLTPGQSPDGLPVIGVLGNIGHEKGIGVLSELSAHFARTQAARLVILGAVDETYPLAPGTTVHGRYTPDEIPSLVARYGISRWFIPSICPETFSFTTQECLATGLPVFAFALGAQGDAVAQAVQEGRAGGTIPLGASADEIAGYLLAER